MGSQVGIKWFAFMYRTCLRPSFATLERFVRISGIHTTSSRMLKEIHEKRDGKTLVVEGRVVPSPREPYLLKTSHEGACPVCSSGLDIKHTDVLILSQFLRTDGNMLPRRITGLCKKQQKRIGTMVIMAQRAGLMSNLTSANSKTDPEKRYRRMKFNKYFYESTIKA